ncbi:MAG: UDP-4-amino-4,6-dideoxy-N-acetyl-beta-L-altrosamine transaminase [Lachnospiraceae bacterium]|nr:UDP-4-amino-4,6-dideoxy-N-acetyl-beta-L-altrosamine transaminase [Lachnospiraceae bacterium]
MSEKLAVFGGDPVRNTRIHYGRQSVDQGDIEAVAATLRGDFITCGPKIKEFEDKLCRYTGAKYAVVVSSGTAALHCTCMAAGIKAGDEVITTPITFAASANCARYCGADVVFADVRYDTMNIDPQKIREKVNERTKAVVAVDFTGQAVEIDEIRKICDDNGMFFIEDAAHSIGTKYKGKMIGSLADMTTFSFHPVKTITGGEGGAILTNSKKLYDRLLLARTHFITRDPALRPEEEGIWWYDQIELGYNYRLTDFQAAMLINQLNKIDGFICRRKEITRIYDAEFSTYDEILKRTEIPESDTCNHLYVMRLNLEKLKCDRKLFFKAMYAENIQAQVHYIPVYWFSYYQSLGHKRGECPIAEKVYSEIISLPLYPLMSDKDVNDVIHAVKKIIDYYRK